MFLKVLLVCMYTADIVGVCSQEGKEGPTWNSKEETDSRSLWFVSVP